jgi:hypothetical protein
MVGGAEALRRALDLLATGDWQTAHGIVQEHKTELAAWLHGIVHTLEGDLDNARYWYRKADRVFRGVEAVQDEITAARSRMQDEPAAGRGRGEPC